MYVLNMAIEWVYNYLYIYMYDELLFMLIKKMCCTSYWYLMVFAYHHWEKYSSVQNLRRWEQDSQHDIPNA